MTPLYSFDAFSYATAMAIGTVLGFFFGLVLEGSGFGRSQNLVAQFYGDDMRVFKVMFSAIVTAMVGMGILGGLGLLELGALAIPATYLWPQIVGGLLLGVGFVISGYCPGTAVVSVSTGYMDGLVTLIGIMLGSIGFGFVYPALESFYMSGDMGSLQLMEVTGLSWPVLAVGVTLMAVGCFFGAEAIERWLAGRQHTEPPPGRVPVRNGVFAAMGAFAAAGLVTLALPSETEADVVSDVATIDATDLASRIIEDSASLYIVDLRDPAACAEKRVQGAMCVTEEDPDGGFVADLPATRTLVFYGASELTELPASAQGYQGPVYTLAGGFEAFRASVLTAPEPPENATPDAVAQYMLASAMHQHFTGTAAKAPPIQARPKAVSRAVKKGGGC